jgi:hypothetical protein
MEEQQSIFEAYTNFRISILDMQRSVLIPWTLLQSNRIGPLKFWLSHGNSYPSLQPLAKQGFSRIASSAASESNFSTFGHIYTKIN